VQNHITKIKEVDMAGFNRPIRKDSLWLRERQIENADEQHKRDLFREMMNLSNEIVQPA
jgi:hypothetical protein